MGNQNFGGYNFQWLISYQPPLKSAKIFSWQSFVPVLTAATVATVYREIVEVHKFSRMGLSLCK